MSKKSKKKSIKGKNVTTGKDKKSSMKNTHEKSEIIIVDGDSNVGVVRTNNEDACIHEKIWDDNAVLAVAIDGLGGYEGGEVAAAIAKEKIRDYLINSKNGTYIELLKQAVTTANNAIFEAAQANQNYYKMGCVLTAAIIDVKNKQVSMVHVGDTRMYGFHKGKLEKISHDHSLVGRMEEEGDLTEEEAMNHPNRNLVDRVLGHELHLSSDDNFIESKVFDLLPNTTFLLCSDGLTDMITTTVIKGVLSCNIELKEKIKALITAALEAGGKDNVTVVLVEYMGDEDNLNKVVEKNKKSKTTNTTDNYENEGKSGDVNDKRGISWGYATLLVVVGFVVGLLLGLWIAENKVMSNGKIEKNTEKNVDVMNISNDTIAASEIIESDSLLTKND